MHGQEILVTGPALSYNEGACDCAVQTVSEQPKLPCIYKQFEKDMAKQRSHTAYEQIRL